MNHYSNTVILYNFSVTVFTGLNNLHLTNYVIVINKILTLGSGIPVGLLSNAGRSLDAKSCARYNNSPSYQSGANLPNGSVLSVINKCADKRAPSSLKS